MSNSPKPTPLLPAECALLATLLQRAIANEQLALEAEGDGLSCTNSAWSVEAGEIDYDDDSPSRPGVHLRVDGEDLDYLTFAED